VATEGTPPDRVGQAATLGQCLPLGLEQKITGQVADQECQQS
jgi:hypothetical protein